MATITKSLTIESQGTYNLTFDLWSYSEWAASAGITTSYASLAALIADEKAVRQLMTVHASVDYFANCPDSTIISTVINNDLCAKWINLRDYAFDTLSAKSNIKSVMDAADKYGYGEWGKINSTTWGALGNVPIMTANNAPYGNVIESGHMSSSIGPRVFDGDSFTTWVGAANALPSYVGYEFVNPIIPKKAHIELNNSFVRTPTKFVIQGSNDGFVSDIDTISEEIITTTQPSASISWDIPLTANKYYTSLRMYITEVAFYSDHGAAVSTLQFYGRELPVKQASAPTDGREYVHIGSDYYTEDWGEKEFATGSTRKTIYDHGVELVAVESVGNNANNYAQKRSQDIYVHKQGSASGAAVMTSNAIDLSSESHNVLGTVIGRELNQYEFGLRSQKTYGENNNISIKAPYGSITSRVQMLDISSVHQSAYPYVGMYQQNSTAEMYMTVDEIWLE